MIDFRGGVDRTGSIVEKGLRFWIPPLLLLARETGTKFHHTAVDGTYRRSRFNWKFHHEHSSTEAPRNITESLRHQPFCNGFVCSRKLVENDGNMPLLTDIEDVCRT